MSPVLSTRGLRKRYANVEALRGVDLDVEKGEVFGFLGPNGAGKTTFTKCVTGFIRPTAGEVRLFGQDVRADPTAVSHRIGLVPDEYGFYPNLTGRQHLDFYGRLLGMDAERRSARIEEVLDEVRMSDRADRRVKGYSHGMKQRICIGQAILHGPELIIFDEPTNGLDPKGAHELRQLIRGLAGGGTTIFLNSHILHEVEEVCKRVAILNEGKVVAASSVADLRSRFADAGMVHIRLERPDKRHVQVVAALCDGTPVLEGDILKVPASPDQVPEIVAALVADGARLLRVEPVEASLEDAFLRLTDAEVVA